MTPPDPGTGAPPAPPREAGAAPRGGSSRIVVPLVVLAGAVVVAHLVTGWRAEGPVVFDDEGGYLRIARHLAGEGPPAGVKYFPGYSLLLTPVHWALGSTHAVFLGVKVLNAALGGLFVVLAYLVSGHLLPEDRRDLRLAASGIVSLYPAFVLASNGAFAENALVPLSMALAYLVARAVPAQPATAVVACTGVLGAYGVVVHPRAAGVLVALGLVAAVWWSPWRAHARRLAVLGVSAGATLLAGYLLVRWERSTATPDSGSYGVEGLAGARLALTGLRDVVVGAAGQVLYLVVTTGGMAVVSGLEIAGALRRVRAGGRAPRDALLVYVGIATVAVLGISAVFISPREGFLRPDAVLYGRYNEGLAGPLFLVGACALLAGRHRLWDRDRVWRGVLPWLVVAALGSAVVVELFQFDSLLRSDVRNPFNVLALYSVLVAMGGVNPLALAGLGIGAGAVLVPIARTAPLAATAAAVAAFVAVSAHMAFDPLSDQYTNRERQRVVARTAVAVDERHGIPCLGIDRFEAPIYHFQLYRWYVDTTNLEWFSSDRGEPPCGHLVATSRVDLAESYPGARLVAREGDGVDSYLWVLAGDLQDSLVAEGAVQ